MRHYGCSESSNKPQTQSHERIFEILFVWKKLNTKNTYHMTSLEKIIGVSVQFCRSVVSDSLQPHGLERASFPVHHQLSELTQTHVHWAGDAIQPSHPLSSSSPLTLNLSQHQDIFKWVLCITWAKYWSFSFSISPSNEYSGLISFRMDWLDLLTVQGSLKSPLQHHSSKASILWNSAFFFLKKNPKQGLLFILVS